MSTNTFVSVAPSNEVDALAPVHGRWFIDDTFAVELHNLWARWRVESRATQFASRLSCVVACGNLAAAIYNGFLAVVPLEADYAELESAVHCIVSSAAVRLAQEKQLHLHDAGSEQASRTLRLALFEGESSDGRVGGGIESKRVVFLRSADFLLVAPV